MLRRGDVFAHAAIRISVELLLRIRTEAEIAAECVVGAIHGVVGAAGRTGTAEQTRGDIDPVALAEVLHLIADRSDDAGDIQSEDRRQLRQRQFRKPCLPMREHVDQVWHHAARLDGDQYVGWPRCRHRHLLKPHRLANLVELGRKHRGHASSSLTRAAGAGPATALRSHWSCTSHAAFRQMRPSVQLDRSNCRGLYTDRPAGR